ncbi:membrane protein containing ABC-2 type transporter domain protein [mine drainage metagenome]|uniref:Membrane protein containing ABC-2 type transporter domain protein n=1 Tax=mine drainage metagenome TaxID=410659 RepID=T1BRY3_9ZZZZ
MAVFHVNLFLNASILVPLCVLGIGAFLAIGLLLSGLAKDSESVGPLTNVVTLPMMFLSGVFFPVSGLPGGLRQVVSLLPLTYLVNGLRGSMLQTGTMVSQRTDILALLVWVLIASFAASRVFRWEQRA